MKRRGFDLQLFAERGEGNAAGAGTPGSGSARGNSGGITYSYDQAEQIAQARAEQASGEALAKYFESQGMTQEEIKTAIADFKTKKAASQSNISALEQQRDEALAKVTEMENTNYLRDKGVKSDDLDYVLFKVGKRTDDKTDFKKAADAFLKENPRFTGQSFRVVSTGKPDGGSGTSQTVNDSINASIRSAFGR